MGHFEDAIGYLEQQLATLEQISSNTILIDKVRNRLSQIFSKCFPYSMNFCHRDELSVT